MLENEIIFVRRTNKKDYIFINKEEIIASKDGFVALWKEQQHLDAMNNSNILHLIIEEKETNEPVGYMIINGLEDSSDNLELMRIVISKKGYGYGPMAIELIKKLAFVQMSTNRLWLDVRIHNNYAYELYKKIGFTEEGILRKCVKINDEYVSIVILSILRHEYYDKMSQEE